MIRHTLENESLHQSVVTSYGQISEHIWIEQVSFNRVQGVRDSRIQVKKTIDSGYLISYGRVCECETQMKQTLESLTP